MNITEILELHALSLETVKAFSKERFLYQTIIKNKGRHFIGIVGPRGVGKTVLLKQIAANVKNSLYLSLDSLEELDLFETIKYFHQNHKISTYLLDEIQHQKGFEKDLKKVYDFLSVRIIFTSSAALSIYEASIDLSRRVKIFKLFPFSFREYVFLKKNIMLPAITLKDIYQKKWEGEHLKQEYLFDDYLHGGLYPFSLEEPDVLTLLRNIIEKVITRDIVSIANLQTDEIDKIKNS